jgi:mannosyl-oligosaccharide alpha-1,2-mannosidase
MDTNLGRQNHRLQQLSCYLPGILALGASTLPDAELSPKEKEIHRWAAHGLAYTCAISFEDQESGLGPEEILMSGYGKRWMEVVDEWELGGRQGDVQPGMGEPEPESNTTRRDYYTAYPNDWLLRPEVKKNLLFFFE